MEIILDSNVLFSALIKESRTRKLILEYEGFFLFPQFIFEELEKHKDELLKKSGMEIKDFNQLLRILLRKVKIIPNEILLPFQKKAFEIIKDIDPDDTIFIACALTYKNSIIWSDDKRLKNQTRIKVLNTKEIMILLEEP